jgi:hypothetical protein
VLRIFLITVLVLVAQVCIEGIFRNPRKKRQCNASMFTSDGRMTTYCTRLRHKDKFHANAFTQEAWVLVTIGKSVTYRYPYEHLKDDTHLVVEGVGEPIYYPEGDTK